MPGPDLVIRDVRIVDGTGAAAFAGDVAVTDGRIDAVGDVGPARDRATRTIDGGGRLVCSPGFVDTHTHDDGALLQHPGLEFKIAQGCTSLVIGNCGFSAVPFGGPALWAQPKVEWDGLAGFRAAVHRAGTAANSIALVGHNTVRTVVRGHDGKGDPSPAELDRMRAEVERAMEEGACGFSTGLIYRPGRYATTEEIVVVARPAGDHGGVYATHMRNEGDGLLEAVDEALRIGREAGCAVHISHHKAAGPQNWGRCADSLAKVDEANAGGHDVTLDVYPYTAGSGPMVQYVNLDNVEATRAWAEMTRLASCPAFRDYEGRTLTDIATGEGVDVYDVVKKILTAPKGDRTVSITAGMSEEDVVTNLRHPLMMVGSDGIPDLTGTPHPRLFGTFPRVLGHYVRENGVIGLEEAVRRMTSLSCRRFGLEKRGEVRDGWWADLVVFDPDTVIDTATYDDPKREPEGIRWVVVNGQVAYDDGRHTGAGAGRLLRYRDEELADR